MRYSKLTIQCANGLVAYYSKYNKDSLSYTIDYDDLNEFDRSELTARFLADNQDVAAESTGLDNPWYAETMLPALTNFLRNPNDETAKYDFQEKWQQGVSAYAKGMVQELLASCLEDFNAYRHGESA